MSWTNPIDWLQIPRDWRAVGDWMEGRGGFGMTWLMLYGYTV